MKIRTFSYSKGINLPKIKSLNLSEGEIEILPDPEFVYVPLKQVKSISPKSTVVKGDKVKINTSVASVGENHVYSSVSGEVTEVVSLPSIYGGLTECVVIKNNNKNSKESWFKPQKFYKKEELLEILKKSSLVDYDGQYVYSKLEKVTEVKKIVINAISDEPFESTNAEVLKHYLQDVLVAGNMLADSFNVKEISLAVTKDAYKSVTKKALLNVPSEELDNLTINIVSGLYPVGDEPELFKVLTKKELTEDNYSSAGVVILDVYTLKALHTLLTTGSPADLRLVTVYDHTESNATEKTVWVKVGSSIEYVVNMVRKQGFTGVRKLVAGGPMRGIALGSEKASVTNGLKSIILFGEHVKDVQKEVECINCGLCDSVCPVNISPSNIDRAISNMDILTTKKLGATKCTRCGCCSYVCPSKRYLTQRVCYSKDYIQERGL